MLKDFSKIETFLMVVKEKNFSRASKKLGISQPAVTQQMKLLEEYLNCKIIERKKNGIKLTKEGEEFLKVALKLEKCVNTLEKEIIRIMNKDLTFIIGASFTIGNYVLPACMNDIKEAINNDVMIQVDVSRVVLEKLLDKVVDLALIESPIFLDGILYREWLEDEMVLFSNSPLPKQISLEKLKDYNWIFREEGSHTKKVIREAFDEVGIDCDSFNIIGTASSSTTVKQTILKAPKDKNPTVSIMSKYVIEDDVQNGSLYCAKIKGIKLKRTFYVAYLKDRKHDAFVENVVNFIMNKQRV